MIVKIITSHFWNNKKYLMILLLKRIIKKCFEWEIGDNNWTYYFKIKESEQVRFSGFNTLLGFLTRKWMV